MPTNVLKTVLWEGKV